MDEVNTLEEAMQWFLRHSSGSRTCFKDNGKSCRCASYPEAEKFYSEEKGIDG